MSSVIYVMNVEKRTKMNKCDMCGKELTIGDDPNCCSDCWDENKEYYE